MTFELKVNVKIIFEIMLFCFECHLLLIVWWSIFMFNTMFALGQRFQIAGMTLETNFRSKNDILCGINCKHIFLRRAPIN